MSLVCGLLALTMLNERDVAVTKAVNSAYSMESVEALRGALSSSIKRWNKTHQIEDGVFALSASHILWRIDGITFVSPPGLALVEPIAKYTTKDPTFLACQSLWLRGPGNDVPSASWKPKTDRIWDETLKQYVYREVYTSPHPSVAIADAKLGSAVSSGAKNFYVRFAVLCSHKARLEDYPQWERVLEEAPVPQRLRCLTMLALIEFDLRLPNRFGDQFRSAATKSASAYAKAMLIHVKRKTKV